MKTRLIFVLIWIFVLFAGGDSFSQEKAATPEKPAAAEATKPPQAKSEPAEAKILKYRMGGVVTALDKATGKITIKQEGVKRERTVHLVLSREAKKDLDGLQVGSAVNIWVTGNQITAFQEVPH